jgi:hypothetical protein
METKRRYVQDRGEVGFRWKHTDMTEWLQLKLGFQGNREAQQNDHMMITNL